MGLYDFLQYVKRGSSRIILHDLSCDRFMWSFVVRFKGGIETKVSSSNPRRHFNLQLLFCCYFKNIHTHTKIFITIQREKERESKDLVYIILYMFSVQVHVMSTHIYTHKNLLFYFFCFYSIFV